MSVLGEWFYNELLFTIKLHWVWIPCLKHLPMVVKVHARMMLKDKIICGYHCDLKIPEAAVEMLESFTWVSLRCTVA